MKITKFAQSCFLVETNNKRILVDPSNIKYENNLLEFWNNIDIILITHKHKDHIHIEAVNKILENPKTRLYTTQEVKDAYEDLKCEILKKGDIINLDNIKIEVVKAVHGYMPFLKGGNEINENVGYIIDDGIKRFYLTSDSICFENNYKCDIIAVPVCDHGLVMGPFEAGLFSKETGAGLVIPIHYDNPKFPISIDLVKEEFDKQEINYKILNVKESIEI